MPDDNLKKLTEVLFTLSDVVSQIAQTAKPEHLNFLEKDLIQQRLSGVNALLDEVVSAQQAPKAGKLDDPTLS
jgi:hypothetical protein